MDGLPMGLDDMLQMAARPVLPYPGSLPHPCGRPFEYRKQVLSRSDPSSLISIKIFFSSIL